MKRLTMCLGAMGLLFGANGTSSGASISFTPRGAQIVPKDDTILDIAATVNEVISFQVFIDTVPRTQGSNRDLPFNLTDFTYDASWDSGELTYTGVDLDGGNPGAGGHFSSDSAPDPVPRPTSGNFHWQAQHSGAYGVQGQQMPGIAPGTASFLLDTWNFTVAKGLNDDGDFDFQVEIVSAKSVADKFAFDLLNWYTTRVQQVEVQPAPVDDPRKRLPEPGTNVLLTTALAGIGMTHWVRRKRANVAG